MRNIFVPLKNRLFALNGINRAMNEIGGAEAIFDIGAASGEYTELFLKRFPAARVYAFEPLPEHFKKLEGRVKKYGNRVCAFNFALYDKSGEKDLYIAPNKDASSFLIKENLTKDHKTIVKMRTLDEFTPDIKKIDLIKIDVEGVELEVLRGAEKTLPKTRSIFVEINPAFKGYNSRDHIEVFELMHENGFGFRGNYSGDYFFRKDK